MKQSVVMGGVLLVGAVACGVAWAFLPALQSPRSSVESAAAAPLERARRLLHQYDARLPYQAAVLDQLTAAGAASDDPGALSDAAIDDYQQIHGRMWAAFQPMQWGEQPSPARANYGFVEQQMRAGASDRAKLLNENDALLRDALTAVEEGLAVSNGDATGRDIADALRLKATILFYTGVADSIRGSVERRQAAPLRSAIGAIADEAASLVGASSLIAGSGVDDKLTEANGEIGAAQAAVDEQRRIVSGLDRSIADLRQRISSVEGDRDRARMNMDRLRDRGIDFSQANAADAFSSAYLDAARRYREADRQVQYLTTGYYPNAEIDASGDFLTGRYVENGSPFNLTIEPGLNHLVGERAAAGKVLAERERALNDWQAAVTRLDDLRDSFGREESDAKSRLEALRRQANDSLTALDDAESSAVAREDAALASFDKSIRTVRDAVAAAGRWVSDAQQQLQKTPMQNQDRSAFKPRSDDRWLSGFVLAQSADAHLARAWTYYDRFVAARENAAVFERARDALGLTDADIAEEREAAQTAREAGIEEVKQAMADLERAHRDAEGHWTLVAQAGSTEYLLALFGDASYVADTIATYRKAVENRETTPAAQAIVSRLHTLESRQSTRGR